jgi:glycosyltransferase involved in cell wall biosynthesis
MPTVSVIVPCYNLGRYLQKCLDSIFNQNYNDFELLIVNDGSTDDSGSYIEDYIRNNKKQNSIKYIVQDNKGLSGARNTGIVNSKGKYLTFLDPDDKWTKNSLRTRLTEFENDSSIGIVYTDTYLERDNILLKDTYVDLLDNVFDGYIYPNILNYNFIIMPTVMVRRTVFDACGLFDEGLRRAEDYDLWIRAAKYGWKYKFINKPTAYYSIRDNSLSRDLYENIRALLEIYQRVIQGKDTDPESKMIAENKSEYLKLMLLVYNTKKSIADSQFDEAIEHINSILVLKHKRIKYSLIKLSLLLFPGLFRQIVKRFYKLS